MKWNRGLGLGWLTLVVLLLVAPAPSGKDDATAAATRRKLRYADRLLAGLVTQDFAGLEANAGKLVELSRDRGWAARQTPEYALFLTELLRSAGALVAAARSKDVDGANAAYGQLTTSCIACHKHIRGDGTKR
jgi:hypothetical protein